MAEKEQSPGTLIWLCWMLWASALLLALLAGWLLTRGNTIPGLLGLVVAAAMAVTGLGLYRGQRWGVVLFGLLAVLGSVNYLVNVVSRYPAGALRQPSALAGAAFSVLLAVLLPAALLYLTLLLWRRSR